MAKLSMVSPDSSDSETLTFPHATPDPWLDESATQPAKDDRQYDYNFSTGDDGIVSPVDLGEPEEEEEEDTGDADDRRISALSSVSSFPGSSLSQILDRNNYEQYAEPRTPTKRDSNRSHDFGRPSESVNRMTSPRSVREYHTAFRHPSSVRAMQMRDEAFSDTQSVVRHHRRSGSQRSVFSHRSSYSVQTSPTKRLSRSYHGTPQKPSSGLRKEFPLVLLHCTLLPPVLLPATGHDEALVCELLPEAYRKRWITLREKLVNDAEVTSRGILIPHPRDEYELLEERLLESLELEKPRIRHDHFLQTDSASGDSGFESGSHTEEEEGECELLGNVECPDCGKKLSQDDLGRRWEVKVYAANGLMRAGAWAAAWQEMEKVDVEIKIWLPEDVRRDVEAKLVLLTSSHPEADEEHQHEPHHPDSAAARDREVYGEAGFQGSWERLDHGNDETGRAAFWGSEEPSHRPPNAHNLNGSIGTRIFQDRKNIVIGLLSVLVLLVALLRGPLQDKEIVSVPATVSLSETLTTTVEATSVDIVTASASLSISSYERADWSSSADSELHPESPPESQPDTIPLDHMEPTTSVESSSLAAEATASTMASESSESATADADLVDDPSEPVTGLEDGLRQAPVPDGESAG